MRAFGTVTRIYPYLGYACIKAITAKPTCSARCSKEPPAGPMPPAAQNLPALHGLARFFFFAKALLNRVDDFWLKQRAA
ncbi:hypothetical protein HMPREF9413_1293 [Paenibacillus sp. HGF7]|nr:hypothetical protein HMPREF9413_1293 [Paenibacillus sp. HGF7]